MFNLNAVLAFFVSREYETIKEFYLLFILLERTELRAASINSCMSVGERQRIHGGGVRPRCKSSRTVCVITKQAP